MPPLLRHSTSSTKQENRPSMGFTITMGLNLILLVAMVAANILSLYHLTTTLKSKPTTTTTNHQPIPEHLIHQLQTIRATINHLTHLQHQNQNQNHPSQPTTIPHDLLLYSHLSPIASSCHDYPELLHKYMTYTPFALCPLDPTENVAESLILRGCHPLPRRRCFSRTPPHPSHSLPKHPFPTSLPDSNLIWPKSSTCKSFHCIDPKFGFDMETESKRFTSYKSELDLPIPQLLAIANSSTVTRSPIRVGIDIGGGTGTFAAKMKDHGVTIVTTTMDLGLPYSEAAALRGVVALHAPLQQRLPVFDGAVDLVRCGRGVNRWIPGRVMEFLLYDMDRVLRGGGFLWLDRFLCKRVDLEKVYKPMIGRLGYAIVKWATGDKVGSKHGEVYVTALLHKPKSRG